MTHPTLASVFDPKASGAQAGPRMVLDLKALEGAKRSLDQGAVTPHYGPWRTDIVQLLNDALATELVCALRYKRHHFTAQGLASPKIAEEFLVHANEETEHADLLARRIVQLGGKPDFSPDSLTRRSHATYDDSEDLTAMIRANLIAERAGTNTPVEHARPTTLRQCRTRPLLRHTGLRTHGRKIGVIHGIQISLRLTAHYGPQPCHHLPLRWPVKRRKQGW